MKKNTHEFALSEYRRVVGRRKRFILTAYGPNMLIAHNREWISRPLFLAWRRMGLIVEGETMRGGAKYVARRDL